jgi:HK97 family phage prohead protease
MLTRDLTLKLKTIDDAGTFTGLAALYGVVDLTGDLIEPGAFKQAISHQPSTGYPLLWCHDQAIPVGLARIEDSPKALVVHGRLDIGDEDGARAFRRIKSGVVKGISFGFLIPDDPAAVSYEGRQRRLKQVHLLEISLVAVPAQPAAQVVSVKSIADARRLLEGLRGGDLGADVIGELRQIHKHLAHVIPDDPDDDDGDDELLRELQSIASHL